MKNKIFAKLKQEFSHLGLGDEVLMSRAASLAATDLVNDDNIDAVVAVQKSDLEATQARLDKRVTDALEKERKKVEAEAAEAEKRAKEEADKKAKEEAEAKANADKEAKEEADKAAKAEADKKAKAEADKKAQEEIEKLKKQGVSDSVIEYIKGLQKQAEEDKKASSEASLKQQTDFDAKIQAILSDNKAQYEAYLKSLEALTQQHNTLKTDYDALKAENDEAKRVKAEAERANFIQSKAKELGVPQWRIDEGFNIAQDASDEVIIEALTKTANNIQTSMLPGSAKVTFPSADNKPTEDEIAAFAKSIVK